MLNYKLLYNKTIWGDHTMKSCFFIGHREADERLLPRLELEIEKLIAEENIRYFYVGGYGGFDRITAAATKRAKQKYYMEYETERASVEELKMQNSYFINALYKNAGYNWRRYS